MNLSTGGVGTSSPKSCNGGPCSAGYVFYREPSTTEYERYGIQKNW
jgi:hypothetical protein